MNSEEKDRDASLSERSSVLRRSKSVSNFAQENDHYFDEYDDIDFQLQSTKDKESFFLPSFLAKYCISAFGTCQRNLVSLNDMILVEQIFSSPKNQQGCQQSVLLRVTKQDLP